MSGRWPYAERTEDDPSWRSRAACKDVATEVFFPDVGEDYAVAAPVCGSCGVRERCLAFAFESKEEYGMWGGMTPKDRRSLRRRRNSGKYKWSAA